MTAVVVSAILSNVAIVGTYLWSARFQRREMRRMTDEALAQRKVTTPLR